MSRLDLVDTAIELLAISQDIPYRLLKNKDKNLSDYKMETFTQIWGNTSGGFESIGGSSITEQRTYVFLPIYINDNCLVYFGGNFAYSVPCSDIFIKDVRERRIAGCRHKDKYVLKMVVNEGTE